MNRIWRRNSSVDNREEYKIYITKLCFATELELVFHRDDSDEISVTNFIRSFANSMEQAVCVYGIGIERHFQRT